MFYLFMQETEESCNGWSVKIRVISRQFKNEVNALVVRSQRNSADCRDSCMWICDFYHWCVTTGGLGPPENWSEHEAGFVNKCQMGTSVACFGSDAGKLLVFPSCDLIIVTISRLETRFLESPAKSLI